MLLVEAGGGSEALRCLSQAVVALSESADIVVRDQVAEIIRVIQDKDTFVAAAATKRATRRRSALTEA